MEDERDHSLTWKKQRILNLLNFESGFGNNIKVKRSEFLKQQENSETKPDVILFPKSQVADL